MREVATTPSAHTATTSTASRPALAEPLRTAMTPATSVTASNSTAGSVELGTTPNGPSSSPASHAPGGPSSVPMIPHANRHPACGSGGTRKNATMAARLPSSANSCWRIGGSHTTAATPSASPTLRRSRPPPSPVAPDASATPSPRR